MHENEVKELLLYIQAGDGRQLSNADLAYWTNELPPMLTLPDAIEAVRLFRNRPEAEVAKYRWLDITILRVYVKRLMDARRAAELREEAKLAIEPAPHVAVNERRLRIRDPEEWDRLKGAGRAEGNADRAYTHARRVLGLPEAEARAAGQAAYEQTWTDIEAEKKSAESPKGTKHSADPTAIPSLGESL